MMAPVGEPHQEQTLAFRGPAEWAEQARTDHPIHLLVVVEENAPPRRVPLRHLPVTIGRNPPAEIILEGATVSRRHCKLHQQGDYLVVTDLGSTNGTFVNNRRIEAPLALEDGAVLSVGAHRLRYNRRSEDEAAQADAMERELVDAADYVASILPRPIAEGPVLAEWFFQPSARLGGDAFGYQMLDHQHFAAFVLDVAGHGTAAALHSVSVANVLRQRLLPEIDFRDPAAVIRSLNRMFPMERHNSLFFTIWYGVYDLADRVLTFATGGHHAGHLIPPPPLHPVPLATRNPSIGIVPDRDMAAARVSIPPGSALYLFSDGVFEIVDRDDRQWSLKEILTLLPACAGPDGPRHLYRQVRSAARPGPLEDDFSAVLLRFP
jgi:serine phosphatase RsbU (regulator of sigma subunit)